jgi:acyl carrier protein
MSCNDSRVLRSQLSLPHPYLAPRDAVEETIAAIWIDILNMDCVGIEDEFSDLGGDSFDATVVLAEVERRLEVHLPLSTLVDAVTVAALAREVARRDTLSNP